MSSIGQIGDGNLLVSSVTLAPVQPPAISAYTQFELGNAAILAASIGLGTNVDTWA